MVRNITLDSNNIVVAIRYGTKTLENEIESETGELGQTRQADGSFIDTESVLSEPKPHEPTNSEIAQMISDLQADLIIAGVI